MNPNVQEVTGIFASIIVLAAISVAIIYGGNTAKVLTAAGGAFSGAIGAATLQSGKAAKAQ